MKKNSLHAGAARMFLEGTAAELMVANPQSVTADAYLEEAAAFLADKNYSAAPVIDPAGRPVGVISQTDIVRRKGMEIPFVSANPEFYEIPELTALPRIIPASVVDYDPTRVRDIMTPLVYTVPANAPVSKVIGDMLARKVHRLFVVGEDGVLIGIISMIDLLRHLRLEPSS